MFTRHDRLLGQRDGRSALFFINKAVDPGLIKVVENEIVPRLADELPQQSSPEQLSADPLLSCFTLGFDREGDSPDLMLRLRQKHIACITYHKHPGENWSLEEFEVHPVRLATGEVVEMALAERGTCLSKKLWVRKIRKLTESGHQTAVIAIHYQMDFTTIAVSMFARWSQENFFRYMRQHYNIDALVDYSLAKIPDTTRVVNPDYRQLDSELRSVNGKFNRRLADFGSLNLETDIEPQKVEVFENKKASLLDEIVSFQEDVEALKLKRCFTNKHIDISELTEPERFSQLATPSKHLIDTIKRVAYRAETAMVNVLRENMKRLDDARQLALSVYQSEADLLPDDQNQTLRVRLHRLANHSNDAAIENLCRELNETSTLFPGTKLRMIFEFGIK